MGINANNVPKTGGDFKPAEPMEAGNYPCRIVQVIDLGLQPQRAWQGEEKPPAHSLMVTYEFTDEFMRDDDGNELLDKPRWLSEEFPLRSLESDLAKSTKRMKALDPKGDLEGDWAKLVGVPCMVTVTQSEGKGKNEGRVFNNIGGVSAMRSRDADRCAPLVNDGKILDLDQPDLTIFKSLPEWLQDKIKSNLEFKGSVLDTTLAGGAPIQDKPAANDEPKGDDIPW
ncbi:putative Phage protein [Vibrio phage 409E50-1]|nr:putative Phage protein [Vibrio phage 464E53-1]CAH9012203.1 putative Phage protein [Vibrio phage 521E56-1]CAH9012364.1 putative Phage protein [Vibrio phage 384E50-1]CAH9012401.1 putative Phage protein [Vibrio phage 409E50-1]CAH9012404.1 putative Phage protein [Vibrio phage 402E50-1]CAH9013447.1 putative Phage protein [Vibrio phage 405E50-1]CAH9013510.1 putative Phage protein [Vibrio phage 413E50-1]